MRTLPILAAATLVVCAACASASSPESGEGGWLSVEPDVVAAGDSVTVTLTNVSDAAVGYNLCTGSLEWRTGGDWQAVRSDRVCTMELRTLQPGGRAAFTFRTDPGLSAGDYRYMTSLELMDTGSRRAVRSEAFRVGG